MTARAFAHSTGQRRQARYAGQLAVLLAIAGHSAFSSHARSIASEVTIQSIEKAWSDRQNRVRTATFRCTELERTMQGTNRGGPSNPGARLPLEDTTNTHSLTLALGQPLNARFERQGLYWNVDQSKFSDLHYVCTYNGIACKALFEDEQYQPYKSGFVTASAEFQDSNDYHLLPLIFAVRPLEARLGGIHLNACAIVRDDGLVDDKPCIIVERALSGGLKYTYWLDEEHDFVVVQQETTVNEQLRARLRIRYRDDPKTRFVPQSWEHCLFQPGSNGVDSTVRTRIDAYEINPFIADSQFDIAFGSRTVVDDSRQGWIYRIEPDGTRITLHSTGPLVRDHNSRGWQLVLVNVLLLAIALGAVAIWKLRHRRLPG